jgi:hypothetical protein
METEIQGYLTEFNILRTDIGNAIQGLNDEGANWHPLSKGTNSIYAIMTHVIGVDNFWVRHVIGRETLQRDRDAEFQASGNLGELLIRWEKTWIEIRAILGKLSHTQLLETRPLPFRPERRDPVTIQWIILHLISHYATHLGHIQLTRQLWEQKTG